MATLGNEHQQLAKAACSLYDLQVDSDAVVDSMYASSCKFSDPLVLVSGTSHVKAQFRSLRMLFREIDFHVDGIGQLGEKLVIEATITYVPKFMPRACALRLKQFTTLTSKAGRILLHEDHWSIHGVLVAIAGFGWLYQSWRQLLGTASSVAVELVDCPRRKTS
ncbi:unnamed protein product [Symbiodinium sp. CCMP2456]|nr:unnamed protein product [Symbiodinium sp. CCMP2456]